ncbi:MAG: glycosyltransferase family 87 protein [Gammaproteobacteria bacterium]
MNLITNRNTGLLWCVYTLFICALIVLTHNHHTVTPNYFTAAQNWLQGKDLYNGTGTGFIYFPTAAILYIPLTKLPFLMSEVIWRVLSIAIFAYGLFCFSSLLDSKNKALNYFFMTLIAIPLGFASARNGQMNFLMAGILLLATVSLSNQKWILSAFLFVSALALKPIAIVFLLLAAALNFRLMKYLILFIFVLIGLSFLTQSPHYVYTQYRESFTMLLTAGNLGVETTTDWAQIFSMLAQFGVPIAYFWQTIIRVLAAVLTLVIAYLIGKKSDRQTTCFYLYMLSAIYLMIFNPRTENNDYIILAPAIGFYLSLAFQKQQKIIASLLLIITIGIAGSYTVGEWLTPGHHTWLAPLMTLVFIIIVGWIRRAAP